MVLLLGWGEQNPDHATWCARPSECTVHKYFACLFGILEGVNIPLVSREGGATFALAPRCRHGVKENPAAFLHTAGAAPAGNAMNIPPNSQDMAQGSEGKACTYADRHIGPLPRSPQDLHQVHRKWRPKAAPCIILTNPGPMSVCVRACFSRVMPESS